MEEKIGNITIKKSDLYRLSKRQIEKLSKFINKVKREKYKDKDFCIYEEKGLSKKINEEEFNLIIQNIETEKVKLIFKLMFYLGLRVSEAVIIKREDIDLKEWILKINNIKAKRIEFLKIPKIIRNEIKNYINKNHVEKDQYLFEGHYNKHISKDHIRNKFRKITLKLGINKVYGISEDGRKLYLYSTHSLRHTFGEKIWRITKYNLELTKKALRHKDTNSTMKYIKSTKNELYNIIENLT